MSDDRETLARLIDVWHRSAEDLVALLRDLDEDDWAASTDLPGWDVKAVAAHCAHLESELAGNPQQHVEVPEAAHVKGLMGQFTEGGVIARRDWEPSRIIDELESSVATRLAAMTADPPTDARAPGPGFAGLIGWSWQTLLSNRPLDLWVHDQDVRRATGRPGGLESPGAAHAADVFARSLPFVLGKKVGAPAGTTLVLEVTGPQARTLAAEIGEDGRGRVPAEVPAEPDVRVVLGCEDYLRLSGGRCTRADVTAEITGDLALGEQVLDRLAVTP